PSLAIDPRTTWCSSGDSGVLRDVTMTSLGPGTRYALIEGVGISWGSPRRLPYANRRAGPFFALSKPTIVQWTAAASGASDVHAKVWCAKATRQPAANKGVNRRGAWSPWAIELVDTKANRPPFVGPKKSIAFLYQAVTKSSRPRSFAPQAACISASCSAVRECGPRKGGLPMTNTDSDAGTTSFQSIRRALATVMRAESWRGSIGTV